MEEVYVRKDTFEETMKRIEAMMAESDSKRQASEARMFREVERVLARHEHDADVIGIALDSMKEQISSLNSRLNWFMTVAGGLIGLMTLAVTFAQFYIAFWK